MESLWARNAVTATQSSGMIQTSPSRISTPFKIIRPGLGTDVPLDAVDHENLDRRNRTDHHQEHDGERRSRPGVAEGKLRLIDVEEQEIRGITRPTLGHDVDEIQRLQSVTDRQGEDKDHRGPEQWQPNIERQPDNPRTIDPGCVLDLPVDPLESGEQENGVEPRLAPNADDGQREQGGIRTPQ